MWVGKKKLRTDYEIELLKQTDAYTYYISNEAKNLINKPVNEGEHGNVPFICMNGEEIRKIEEKDGFRVYDAGEYLLYEREEGIASDEERVELVANAKKLNADLIYSDVDHITRYGKRHTPFFKPDFGIDTYRCYDYVSDFYAIKKLKSKMDFALLENIAHVTKPLFHYNTEDNISYARYDKQLNNGSYKTDAFYIDEADASDDKNKISVIIPSKDNPHLISKCLDGIKNAKVKSGINTIDVIIVDNGSTDIHKEEITRVIDIYKNTEKLDITYIYKPSEFNFSAMCNLGAKNAKGEYFLFMNDDIEVTDELFLLKLLYFAKMDHVGAVSCKLLYPGKDRRIQHVGITQLKYPGPSHKLATFTDDKSYYLGRNLGVHNCLAVTGACLMVSKEKYFKIGGFHDKMKVGYNDVDLCVCLYENGYMNVVNCDAVLIHHESITRGADSASVKKLKRLDGERALLYERHPWIIEKGDPFYNPNLAPDFLDYRVNVIPDFERRDYVSKDKTGLLKKTDSKVFEKPDSKGLFFNIEDVTPARDFIEIKGWALINKKDNYLFDTYVAVLNAGDNLQSALQCAANAEKTTNVCSIRVYETAPVYRNDLRDVFKEANFTDISGFFVRIPISELLKTHSDKTGKALTECDKLVNEEQIDYAKLISELKLGIIVKNKQTGRKYYARKR